MVYETFITFAQCETRGEPSQDQCLIGLLYLEKRDSFLPSCKPAELTVGPSKTQEINPCLRDAEAGVKFKGKFLVWIYSHIFVFYEYRSQLYSFASSVVKMKDKQSLAKKRH